MNNGVPLVTIRCLVYNHAPYLRQCLDGFVKQKTNFRFEALIHDDASTDGSANIIREYAERYPQIIKPIYAEKNRFSQFDGSLFRILNEQTKGKYVAYCEGDDYWISEDKLQKQVDFLESHPDFVGASSNAKLVSEDGTTLIGYFPGDIRTNSISLQDLLKKNYIQTCTVMYRWKLRNTDEYERLVPPELLPGDWMIALLHARYGRIYYSAEPVAAYRLHSDSLWSGSGCSDDFYLRKGYGHLIFYQEARRLFGNCFDKEQREMMHDVMCSCIASSDFALLKRLQTDFPVLYDELSKTFSKQYRVSASYILSKKIYKLIIQNKWKYKIFRLLYNIFRINN